jgi:hypothetical protein
VLCELARLDAALLALAPPRRPRAVTRITERDVRDVVLAIVAEDRASTFTASDVARRGVHTSSKSIRAALFTFQKRGMLERAQGKYRYVSPPAYTQHRKSPVTVRCQTVGAPTGRTLRTGDKQVDALLRSAEAQGATVARTQGGHYRVRSETGGTVIVSASGSDRRALATEARLRLLGVRV